MKKFNWLVLLSFLFIALPTHAENEYQMEGENYQVEDPPPMPPMEDTAPPMEEMDGQAYLNAQGEKVVTFMKRKYILAFKDKKNAVIKDNMKAFDDAAKRVIAAAKNVREGTFTEAERTEYESAIDDFRSLLMKGLDLLPQDIGIACGGTDEIAVITATNEGEKYKSDDGFIVHETGKDEGDDALFFLIGTIKLYRPGKGF